MKWQGVVALSDDLGSKQKGRAMARIVWGIIAVLVAVWVAFAVLRALGGLIHLALVVAIAIVAYNLISGLRRRNDSSA
jgi:hypothetical protein